MSDQQENQYHSNFGTPVFILLCVMSLFADAFNVLTIYLLGISVVWTLILRAILLFMSVRGTIVNHVEIGFISPTLYLIFVYFAEKAKENSPLLAKADEAASGSGVRSFTKK